MRQRVLRVEPHRFFVIGAGVVVVFLGEIDVAAAVVGESVVRVETDRLVVVGQRVVVVLFVIIRIAAAVMRRVAFSDRV